MPGRLVFTIRLDWPAATAVTVDFATVDGTAEAGRDYVAYTGTLTFAAGETEKTVTVWTLPDAVWEGTETFTLAFSNPQGVTLTASSVTGTILNDDVGTRPNPRVDAVRYVAPGESIDAADLFDTTDNVLPLAYEFWDGSPSAGQFFVDGVAQAANRTIRVASADLADTVFTTAATPAADKLWVRFDYGNALSDWVEFRVEGTVKAYVEPLSVTAGLGQLVDIADLLRTQGSPVLTYEFLDSTNLAASGTFAVSGQGNAVVGRYYFVAADEVEGGGGVFIKGAGVTGSGEITVRAWTAGGAGAWHTIRIDTVDLGPSLAVHAVQHANALQTLDADDLFTALPGYFSSYQVWDAWPEGHTGAFLIDGVEQVAGRALDVADPSLLTYRTASTAMTDTLWVRGWNGMAYTEWMEVQVVTAADRPPVVQVEDVVIGLGQSRAASRLFTAVDPDGDLPSTVYEFWDGGAGAHTGAFYVNGVQQAANTAIRVSENALDQVEFRAASATVTEKVWIRANDNGLWSEWEEFRITSGNNLPILTVPAVQYVNQGSVTAAADLFDVVDPDGDTIVSYGFWDGAVGNHTGAFFLDGVRQTEGQAITISAADLDRLEFNASPNYVNEKMWVRAFDGQAWSAWNEWTMVQRTTDPVVTMRQLQMLNGGSVAVADLFSWTDQEGDVPTSYDLWDGRGDGAAFTVDGVVQASGISNTVAMVDFPDARLVAGSLVADNAMWLRLNGSGVNTLWQSFTTRVVAGEDLTGTAGNDLLVGNDRANRLVGGAGDDVLVGGGDADWFVVGQGHDVIADFADDVVDLSGVAGLTTFAQLLTLGMQDGANTVFDFGGGNTLTLRNMDKDDLVAGDFIV